MFSYTCLWIEREKKGKREEGREREKEKGKERDLFVLLLVWVYVGEAVLDVLIFTLFSLTKCLGDLLTYNLNSFFF